MMGLPFLRLRKKERMRVYLLECLIKKCNRVTWYAKITDIKIFLEDLS